MAMNQGRKLAAPDPEILLSILPNFTTWPFMSRSFMQRMDSLAQRIQNLENCTGGARPTKEEDGIMANSRRRIVFPNGEVKWISASSQQEENERILQAYIDAGYVQRPSTATPVLRDATFAEYAPKWLAFKRRQGRKDSTMRSNECYVHKHLLPAFGDKCLSAITREDVQTFLDGLAGKGLAKQTVKHNLLALSGILELAKADKCVTENVAKSPYITISTSKVTRRDALPLSEVTRLCSLRENLPMELRRILGILLFTGARRGEMLALRWEDIDRESGVVHITHAITFNKKGAAVLGTTKSKAGVRDVPLMTDLLEWLGEPASGYIVGGEKPLSQRQFTLRWEKIQKAARAAGMPEATTATFTPHVLRHTFATLAAESNVDSGTLQTMLGHDDPKTTRRYTHLHAEHIAAQAPKLNAAFQGLAG